MDFKDHNHILIRHSSAIKIKVLVAVVMMGTGEIHMERRDGKETSWVILRVLGV